MLFNSYTFIFLFLPLTFAVFFLLARASHVMALAGWRQHRCSFTAGGIRCTSVC
jgi:hypothetical protein